MRRAIECKRDGGRIAAPEWSEILSSFVAGEIDDGQMAALAMACLFRGLDLEETVALTAATIDSGERIDLGLDAFVLDKHSSGGVGDTVSLIAVPLVAACGVPVAKVSGRALGHTGGTLDKLEAIAGVRTEIEPAELARIVRRTGCAIVAQSAKLVPADKKLYALRDRTATVPSIGLITASMVSKKIASGADGIVYDVKCGSGAFMEDEPSARALARSLVEVTERFARRAVALITDMNEPLGPAVGAGLEAIEARDYLRGARRDPRLHRAIHALAGAMLELAGHSPQEAVEALAAGSAYERFVAMIEAQGGSRAALERLVPAENRFDACALSDGYVVEIDGRRIGELARSIEGRGVPCSGIRIEKRRGSAVRRGEPLATAIGATAADADALIAAFEIGPSRPEPRQLVVDILLGSSPRSTSEIK